MMFDLLKFFAEDVCTKPRFFGLPPWYEYLPYQMNPITKRCEVAFGHSGSIDFLAQLLPIGLAILDMLLTLAGIVVVGFVIYGGIKYILSQGEPSETKYAIETIINALIGGVIVLIAIAVVSFIGNRLGGG